MKRSTKHWYCTDWNDDDNPASAAATMQSGVGPWVSQSAVGLRVSQSAVGLRTPDAWTRDQTTLTTFGGDDVATTPRRTATEAQATAVLGSRRWSNNDLRTDSADGGHECCMIAVQTEQSGDVVAGDEQCRCPSRAFLVVADHDDMVFGEDVAVRAKTPKNGPSCPSAPRRGYPDLTDTLSLNRKPKMVVKPNCDQAIATSAASLLHYDVTSGRRPAKHLPTGSARDDEDCNVGVPDNVRSPATTYDSARPTTLQPRCSRSASGQSFAETSQKQHDYDELRNTYAPRLFFADPRTPGNASDYRVESYDNGFIGNSEKSAINRPSVATTTSYGCGHDQASATRRISTSGFAGSSNVEVVKGSGMSRRRCKCLAAGDGWLCRLVVSMLTSFVVGWLSFSAVRYQLRCSFPVAVGVAVSASTALLVALLLSRRCRCVVALMVPAVPTNRGRAGVVLLTVATLLSGPAVSVEFNVREMARSLTCSADVAYNQTLLLLQPFDSLLERVYITMLDLDSAVADVERGLQVLDRGLDTMETDVHNGRLQLYGTGKTCRVLIDRAFNQCMSGIQSARDQCIGVIGALGTVYHHARHILDSINPDRWAPKHQLLLNQRRRVFGATDSRRKDKLDITKGDDSDICEPLSTSVVCQSLNDSEILCQPSQWAGDAIQDAINATQAAMHDLQRSLQARRTASATPSGDHDSASGLTAEADAEPASAAGIHFRTSLAIAGQLVYAVGALMVVSVAHAQLSSYIRSDVYYNAYVTAHFRSLDDRYRKATGAPPLLPLRAHERPFVADISAWRLATFERRARWRGLAVFFLLFLISVAVVGFDQLIYWILVVVTTHAVDDTSDHRQFSLPVHGGIVDELMTAFVDSGLRPDGPWPPTPGSAVDPTVCLPSPSSPSTVALLPLAVFHAVLAVGGVILAARCRRARIRISGHYYPERAVERAVYLYGVMTSRRRRVPRLLRAIARCRARRNQRALVAIPSVVRLPACWRGSTAHSCLVCQGVGGELIGCRRPSSSRSAAAASGCCTAVYCGECWEDLGRQCPLCQHQSSSSSTSSQLQDLEAAVELLDAESDQLQMHCAGSWQSK